MSRHLITLSVLLVFSAFTFGQIPTKDCGSKFGSVVSVNLSPAPKGSCTFPRGTNVTANIRIKLNEVTKNLKVVCKGDVVVWVPFPLPNPDACAQGVTCPTTSGTEYTFSTAIPIKSEYPAIDLAIQMEFQDDNGDDAICFQFPGEIC